MRLNSFYTCAFVGFVTEVSVLKKAFEIYVVKIVHSFDSTLSHVMQTSFRFPSRRMESSKINISRHISIITVVKAAKTRTSTRNSCALSLNPKAGVWAYFCAISPNWEVLQVMLSTFHTAGGGVALYLLLFFVRQTPFSLV